MPIEFHCPTCDRFLTTPDNKAGAVAKCPGCSSEIEIPKPETVNVSSNDAGPGSADSTGPMKECPFCGEEIRAEAKLCRYCRTDLDGGRSSSRNYDHSHYKPHRGGMIIAFAILGWVVFPIFSVLAWVFANQDLREMDHGIMDPAGRDLTHVGKIIGMVQCIIMIISIIALGLFLVFGLLVGFARF